MDNIWQKDKNNKMSSGEDFQPDPRRTGKIIWERDEDNGWETRSAKARPVGNRAPGRRVESGWNYDRYYHPGWGSNLKKIITNKFLVQTVVSLLIFVVALGIYDRQDPGSRVASRMVQYLLNVDVNFEPVLGRIVKLVFPELTDSPITPGGGVMPATTDPAATPGGGQANSAPQGSDTVTNPVLGTPAATDPLGTPSTAAGTGQKMAIPVNGTVIKKFGWVEDSVTGIKRYHEGIDIKAPEKTKVCTLLDGKVTSVGETSDLGKYVIITHDGQLVSLYGQLGEITVKQGELVKSGEQLGTVGKKGTEAEEAHLHLELREKGEAVDPWLRLSREGI